MSLLITGVAGFIGSNFLYYYLDKYKERKIIGLDNLTYAGNLSNLDRLLNQKKTRFQFIKGNIGDRLLVKKIFLKYKIKGVLNFAAESHVDRSIEDPQVFLKTNILGTQNLLEVAKKNWLKNGKWIRNVKFLQVSTDEVYGSLDQTGLFTEETPLDPHSPYSASKASSDLIVKAYYDTYGIPINITRSSNNYGPYQFPEKLIPLVIHNALNHKSIPVYGDGKQIRDWLYVIDHCQAIDLVFEKGLSGEIFNIGGKNEKENLEIINIIIQILCEKTSDDRIADDLITHVKDRLGHDRRYAIDASKIENELGWTSKVNFWEGIEITIQWYLNNLEWLNKIITGEYIEFYEKNYHWR